MGGIICHQEAEGWSRINNKMMLLQMNDLFELFKAYNPSTTCLTTVHVSCSFPGQRDLQTQDPHTHFITVLSSGEKCPHEDDKCIWWFDDDLIDRHRRKRRQRAFLDCVGNKQDNNNCPAQLQVCQSVGEVSRTPRSRDKNYQWHIFTIYGEVWAHRKERSTCQVLAPAAVPPARLG